MRNNFYKDKNIIITGASGGLGKEISKQLYEQGANLFLITSEKSDVSEIMFAAPKIYRCDFNNTHSVQTLIREKFFNAVDILINCAGVFPLISLEETTETDFDRAMNINCKIPFILSQKCAIAMKNRDGGLIINIGSSSAYFGSADTGIYCISKHALLGLSRSLSKELKKYNIRTLIFSPGSIKTKMGKQDFRQDFETFLDPKEVAEFIVHTATFDNEMIVDEVRMNRVTVL